MSVGGASSLASAAAFSGGPAAAGGSGPAASAGPAVAWFGPGVATGSAASSSGSQAGLAAMISQTATRTQHQVTVHSCGTRAAAQCIDAETTRGVRAHSWPRRRFRCHFPSRRDSSMEPQMARQVVAECLDLRELPTRLRVTCIDCIRFPREHSPSEHSSSGLVDGLLAGGAGPKNSGRLGRRNNHTVARPARRLRDRRGHGGAGVSGEKLLRGVQDRTRESHATRWRGSCAVV